MRKIIENIENAATHEAERLKAFQELADAQRGAPEIAMDRAQHICGGGVLNMCIEHVGDLTHRMAEMPDFIPYCGYENVKPKVDRCLNVLRSTYQPRSHPDEHGFHAEFMQNMRNNAHYRHPDLAPEEALEKHMEKVALCLKKYADEHRKLKVYNPMQQCARDAAIALGDMDFNRAKKLLEMLDACLDTPEHWKEEASKFDPVYAAHAE